MSVPPIKTGKEVLARDPAQHGQVTLTLHPQTVATMVRHRRPATIGQFVGLILTRDILLKPTAMYKGLMRPMLGSGVDDTIVAYITQPGFTYALMASGVETQQTAPKGSVFVVFASFDDTVIAYVRNRLGAATKQFDGVLLNWEWTLADPSAPHLPADYQTRYRSTLWVRP